MSVLEDDINNLENPKEMEINIFPGKSNSYKLYEDDGITKKYEEVIKASEDFIKKLGFGEEIIVQENKENIPQNAVNVVTSEMEIFIPFTDLVNIEEETLRLEKEKEKILAQKEITDKMLGNPGFVAKAPAAKVEEEKQKQAKFNEMIKAIDERIENLKNM